MVIRLPKFSANVHCGQTAEWIKMVLDMEVGLSPGDIVSDGDPALLPKRERREPPPQFSADFYCVQTAGCIKMPLGMVVGLSTRDFVLDGDPTLLLPSVLCHCWLGYMTRKNPSPI